MWILALEAFVALCMLVLIVWLTTGSARRRESDPGKDRSASDTTHNDGK